MNNIENNKKPKIAYDDFINMIRKKIANMSTKANKEERKQANDNIFYILGIQDFEIRHSNFLKWLFKNEEDFLKKFLIHKDICNLSKEYVNSLSFAKSDFDVKREFYLQTNGRSIDIVIDFKKDKLIVVIENKWKAGESEMQLADYYNAIENSNEYNDYKRIFVYLTTNGRKPKSEIDQNNYISVSYEKILEILENIKIKNKSSDKMLIINHYKEVLRENTIKVMDRVKDYYKLYEENKKVMVEMVEYIPNIKIRAELERKILQGMGEFELDSLNQNTFIWFTPIVLKEKLAKNNLSPKYLQFCLSNEPYNVFGIQFVINKDQENRHIKFSNDFRKKFNRVDKNKDADYAILLSENLVVSNKSTGYLTENQFQEEIMKKLKQIFSDKNSTYNEIINYVLNYEF